MVYEPGVVSERCGSVKILLFPAVKTTFVPFCCTNSETCSIPALDLEQKIRLSRSCCILSSSNPACLSITALSAIAAKPQTASTDCPGVNTAKTRSRNCYVLELLSHITLKKSALLVVCLHQSQSHQPKHLEQQ